MIIILILLMFPVFGQIKVKDTIFIRRDSIRGTAQSIYFDDNKKSEFYKEINNWKFCRFDNETYDYSMNYLKENKQVLLKRQPLVSYKKWITLKQYKGCLYAYHPCDFIMHYKVSINDTTYVDWTADGPTANIIIKQSKINESTYLFKLTGVINKDRNILIHIIDNQKGIAVFEENNEKLETYYYLMIAADKIETVPLIVNNCENYKQIELDFEEPDYSKLLNLKSN